MGLAASPAAFIQMMSKVFKDKTRWNYLFCNVDDLFLVSSSFSEHFTHLKEVLHNLSINNLVINPTKTLVAYPEIEYLGYIINQHGIRISDSKIKAIKIIRPPKINKSLQRLLGLLQYFRKHIPNFSRKTANVRQLLRNDTKFIWTDNCTAELEELKVALTSNPIMKPLQPNRPVYLTVDAGLDGIGSMLWQIDDDNVPHVCAYLSVATTPNQKKWLAYQLEMYGLAVSLRAYENLLLANGVHVFTDNAVVVQLHKCRPITAREKRLIAYLSRFRLNIRFVKGGHNLS